MLAIVSEDNDDDGVEEENDGMGGTDVGEVLLGVGIGRCIIVNGDGLEAKMLKRIAMACKQGMLLKEKPIEDSLKGITYRSSSLLYMASDSKLQKARSICVCILKDRLSLTVNTRHHRGDDSKLRANSTQAISCGILSNTSSMHL